MAIFLPGTAEELELSLEDLTPREIVAELDNGDYSEWKCSLEDIVMPMCRSPQISDALLQASKVPANDNRLPVRTGIRYFRESKSTVRFGRQAILVLCVTALLLL